MNACIFSNELEERRTVTEGLKDDTKKKGDEQLYETRGSLSMFRQLGKRRMRRGEGKHRNRRREGSWEVRRCFCFEAPVKACLLNSKPTVGQ